MSSPTLSTKLHQIAAQAADKTRVFTTLAHLIDEELLLQAYRLTRKDGAPGIDGQTGTEYAENLESNLKDLYERLRTRRYRATPARRVRIRKEDGSERPIAVSAFEDKIVQRAVVMLLSAIYEQDFYEFSYGFRPRVGAHVALRALRQACMDFNGGWIVDADIRGFFDGLDRGILREILRRRVNDGGILRLIGKWFNRLSRIHPLLGTVPSGILDSEETNDAQALTPSDASSMALVQAQPPHSLAGTTPVAEPQAPRPLRVLCDQGQLRVPGAVVRTHPQGVAEVAESPQPGVAHQLGEVPTDREVLPAAAAQDRPCQRLRAACRVAKVCAGVVPRPRLLRNRMNELFTYGSVGGPVG